MSTSSLTRTCLITLTLKRSITAFALAGFVLPVGAENTTTLYGGFVVPPKTVLEQQAEAGDPIAQYKLGSEYYTGENRKQDYERAHYWWQQAAMQGDTVAQYNLGTLYDSGKGVTQDYTQARYWYQKAADKHDAYAQYNLGNLYRDGKGGARDPEKARYWLEQAAAQGDTDAQSTLAEIYYHGELPDPEHRLTYYWLEQAAMRGHTPSQYWLGNLYQQGDGVTADADTARKWWEAAADLGNEQALKKIAQAYRDGAYGIVKNKVRALDWYKKSVQKYGYTFAYTEVGILYANDTPPDYAKARQWWQRGLLYNDSAAQYHLGLAAYYGRGRVQDIPLARDLLNNYRDNCAATDHPDMETCGDAAYHLALIANMESGPAIAETHWRQAALWEHDVALAYLATLKGGKNINVIEVPERDRGENSRPYQY